MVDQQYSCAPYMDEIEILLHYESKFCSTDAEIISTVGFRAAIAFKYGCQATTESQLIAKSASRLENRPELVFRSLRAFYYWIAGLRGSLAIAELPLALSTSPS